MFSIVSASYTGHTRGQSAEVRAVIEFLSRTTNTSAVLFSKDAAVKDFKVSGGGHLWRQGDKILIWLPEAGPATAEITLLVGLTEESGKRRLDFAIPSALGSRVRLPTSTAETR